MLVSICCIKMHKQSKWKRNIKIKSIILWDDLSILNYFLNSLFYLQTSIVFLLYINIYFYRLYIYSFIFCYLLSADCIFICIMHNIQELLCDWTFSSILNFWNMIYKFSNIHSSVKAFVNDSVQTIFINFLFLLFLNS